MCAPFLSALILVCGSFCSLLDSARSAEGIEHRVIPFVTGVFKILVAPFLSYRKGHFPRSGVCLGVVNRHFIFDGLWIHAGKSLGQLERVTGRSATAVETDAGFVWQKIRGLDNERIALPMPSGISHIGSYIRPGMRSPIQGN